MFTPWDLKIGAASGISIGGITPQLHLTESHSMASADVIFSEFADE